MRTLFQFTLSVTICCLAFTPLASAQEEQLENQGSQGQPKTQTKIAGRRPNHIAIVYSPDYLIDLGGIEKLHPFDIHKYGKIHRALLKKTTLTQKQTHIPEPLTKEQIRLVHSDEFLEGLTNKATVARWLEADVLKHVEVDLDKGVLEKFRYSAGGTIAAGRLALKHGLAVNLGGGYHHAKPDMGEGFCIYADIPIAIRQLQQDGLIQRVLIVDVDAHQGNGTICLSAGRRNDLYVLHARGRHLPDTERGRRSGCRAARRHRRHQVQ